jgi:hypothetical protein
MTNVIGFDTPSKRKAIAEAQTKQENNPQAIQLGGGTGMNAEKLKAETLQRLSQLGDIICGNNFQQYPPQQRQQILLDFAYYSKVADTVL